LKKQNKFEEINMRRKVTKLSIDGGGIRGIIPAVKLNYIEEGLQRKTGDNYPSLVGTKQSKVVLSDYFDMIAGTSAGGILTCFYLLPESLPALADCFVVASHMYKAGALYLPACRVSPRRGDPCGRPASRVAHVRHCVHQAHNSICMKTNKLKYQRNEESK
jgi:hypothetical protein